MTVTECLKGIGPLSPIEDVRTAEINPSSPLKTKNGEPMIAGLGEVKETRKIIAGAPCAYEEVRSLLGGDIVYAGRWCQFCARYFAGRRGKSLGSISSKSLG